MNLVLIRGCSNSCPYCFETAERKKEKQGSISMENVEQFAKWVRNARLESLQLVGGEPFLHPKLAAIVTKFHQECLGTKLMILTGGIFDKQLLDNLSPENIGIAFNVNEPRDYKNQKMFDKVVSNVETAIKKGFKVVLGFNVWRLDFDIDFMPNLASNLARSNFRWAVANPQLTFPSSVVNPNDFSILADQCFAMLQKSARLNVDARLDCPLPICFFKDSQLGWIRQYHPGTAERMGFCGPALDVTPELEVIRCFALSELVRVKLKDYSNEKELADWFLTRIEPQLLKQGCFSQCSQCPHFTSGRCYGGCLAWHKCEINPNVEPLAFSLALNMADDIDSDKADMALHQYEQASPWLKTSMPTFEASIAAFRLNKWHQALQYAAYAQDMTSDNNLKKEVRELMKNIPLDGFKFTNRSSLDKDSRSFISCPISPVEE
jgi:cyclic pyranopterin phosphate synthase